MAVLTRAGRAGEKEAKLRFSHPKGQVTITSSKSVVLFEAVVMVTTGGFPLWVSELKPVTFVEDLSSTLTSARLAIRSRIDL